MREPRALEGGLYSIFSNNLLLILGSLEEMRERALEAEKRALEAEKRALEAERRAGRLSEILKEVERLKV